MDNALCDNQVVDNRPGPRRQTVQVSEGCGEEASLGKGIEQLLNQIGATADSLLRAVSMMLLGATGTATAAPVSVGKCLAGQTAAGEQIAKQAGLGRQDGALSKDVVSRLIGATRMDGAAVSDDLVRLIASELVDGGHVSAALARATLVTQGQGLSAGELMVRLVAAELEAAMASGDGPTIRVASILLGGLPAASSARLHLAHCLSEVLTEEGGLSKAVSAAAGDGIGALELALKQLELAITHGVAAADLADVVRVVLLVIGEAVRAGDGASIRIGMAIAESALCRDDVRKFVGMTLAELVRIAGVLSTIRGEPQEVIVLQLLAMTLALEAERQGIELDARRTQTETSAERETVQADARRQTVTSDGTREGIAADARRGHETIRAEREAMAADERRRTLQVEAERQTVGIEETRETITKE